MWKLGFKCSHCQKSFEVPEPIVKSDKKRSFLFCSAECYNVSRSKRMGGIIICETCHRDFFVTAARIKQTSKNGHAIRFCSMKCYQKKGDLNPRWGKKMKRESVLKSLNHPNRKLFQSGKNNPNYKRFEYNPHKRANPDSARRVEKHKAPACVRCGWDLEKSVLQVHHKDRNPRNNVATNLEVLCPNCHECEHFIAKDGRWRATKKPRKAPPVQYIEL